MKLKVPFVKNKMSWKGKGWCGAIALASILRYYKDNSSVEEIVRIGGKSPRGLAYFCLSNGFKVDYVCRHSDVKVNRLRYSSKLRKFLIDEKSEQCDQRFKKKCETFSAYRFIKKKPNLRYIKACLKHKRPVLLYLNIAAVFNKEGLWPHYVAVVGSDKHNFYVHNIFPKNEAYQKIPKTIFEKAMVSNGMDSPLIVIS